MNSLSLFPRMVYSDRRGQIYVHPRWRALASDGGSFVLPQARAWISLPRGSSFFFLPAHRAIGFDPDSGAPAALDSGFSAVSAFLIPGYTRLYLPAAQKTDPSVTLPLWPYAAVGYKDGRFVAAGVLVDRSRRQKPGFYRDPKSLKQGIAFFRRRFPSNRLVKHLSHCALHYQCRNAQNLFLGRWEAPLPVSPVCNSRCLGCLSFAQNDCSSSHERIRFVPDPEELAQVGLEHLKKAPSAIVSFGQGCEGEPLLQEDVVREAILLIRRKTKRGTIHMNTNGSKPKVLLDLARAGLDSVRVSLNSLDPRFYEAYYRPKGYGLEEVLASVETAHAAGLFVSLNYLTLPGAADQGGEINRLVRFLKKGSVHLLQLRNLCIDPDVFRRHMPAAAGEPQGILNMIDRIRRECPRVKIGYFNPPARSAKP